MLFHSYLRNGVVYVPTVVKLQTGAYVDVEPVAVTSVADTDGLRRAFSDAIARKNAIVPPPPKDKVAAARSAEICRREEMVGFCPQRIDLEH